MVIAIILLTKFDDVAHRMLKNILDKNSIVNEMMTMTKMKHRQKTQVLKWNIKKYKEQNENTQNLGIRSEFLPGFNK